MSRYIDADDVIELVWRVRLDTRERIAELINNAPTADVVPVVHCKGCKKYAREEWKRKLDEPHNWADTEWKMEFSGCMGFDDPEKGYCYAGERKGES